MKIILSLIALLFFTAAPAETLVVPNYFDDQRLSQYILYYTYIERTEHNLAKLKPNLVLDKAALEHSQDMRHYGLFSHTSKARGKRTIVDRAYLVGIANTFLAENIITAFTLQHQEGVNVFTPAQTGGGFRYNSKVMHIPPHSYVSLAQYIVTRWMNSKGHRKNILNPQLVYLGVGSALYFDHKFANMPAVLSTQNFADQ